MEHSGKGKLSKIVKRAPAIRLTSSASYTRTTSDNTLAVPFNSTYLATVSNITMNDMTRRCVASREEQKHHNLVLDAAKSIPLDVVDNIENQTKQYFAHDTATKVELERTHELAVQSRTAPFVTESIAALADTLSTLPRHGIRSLTANFARK